MGFWGTCLWSWRPRSPPERGGEQEGSGSHSSWEATWAGPAPPFRHRLGLAQLLPPLLPASVGLPDSPPGLPAQLGPQGLPLVPGAAQKVGVEGQEARQPVRLWEWACVSVVPEL